MTPPTRRLRQAVGRRIRPVLRHPAERQRARRLVDHPDDRVLRPVEEWSDHIAILATHPRGALTASVIRLLELLRDLDVTVILVANEAPDRAACTEAWIDHAAGLIHRPNLGRDFGAYRRGMEQLLATAPIPRIRRVSFFNDSVIHLPTSAPLITALIGSPDPAVAVTTVATQRPRVQAFAMGLDASTALSPRMQRFWRRMVPSDDREIVIRRGERRLSRILRAGAQSPVGLVSFNTLDGALGGDWSDLTPGEVAGMRWALRFRPGIASSVQGGGPDLVDEPDGPRRAVAQQILRTLGPNHPFGLLAGRTLGMPIKVDLIAKGICTAADVDQLFEHSGIEASEREDLLELMGAHRVG